jgi:Cu/Ag efflux protein CusF
MRPCTVSSLRPRLRIVSIMPGIESRAPERTAKRSGLARLPKPLPRIFSMRLMASSICASISFGSVLPCCVEPGADLRRDGEAGRHRQPDAGHFREVRALAADLVCLAAILTACHPKAAPPAASMQVFAVKGVIKELEPDGKTAIIRHEAITGYMQAMTMPFEVRDTNLLRGLKAGDAISFKLAVTPSEGWIQSLTKLGSAAPQLAPQAAPQPALHVSRALEPLGVGDKLPDYHFTDELGQPVSLSQFKGQVLAFTFFFTSCPFPEFCPHG